MREEDVAEAILCSDDPDEHVARLRAFADAGYDHVVVQQCGDDQKRLIALYRDEVLPRLRA